MHNFSKWLSTAIRNLTNWYLHKFFVTELTLCVSKFKQVSNCWNYFSSKIPTKCNLLLSIPNALCKSRIQILYPIYIYYIFYIPAVTWTWSTVVLQQTRLVSQKTVNCFLLIGSHLRKLSLYVSYGKRNQITVWGKSKICFLKFLPDKNISEKSFFCQISSLWSNCLSLPVKYIL